MTREQASPETPDTAPLFNPFAVGFEMWNQLTQQQMRRWHELRTDFIELEKQNYQRARRVATAMTTMFDENLAYLTQLSSEWRKA